MIAKEMFNINVLFFIEIEIINELKTCTNISKKKKTVDERHKQKIACQNSNKLKTKLPYLT